MMEEEGGCCGGGWASQTRHPNKPYPYCILEEPRTLDSGRRDDLAPRPQSFLVPLLERKKKPTKTTTKAVQTVIVIHLAKRTTLHCNRVIGSESVSVFVVVV